MPIVLIWLPEGANTYGHVALQTDKYYISFWPIAGKEELSEASITGRLHFQELLDWDNEGSPQNPIGPTSRHVIVNVTNEEINRVYEKLLRYNNINPKEVTLEAANRKPFRQCYRQLPLTCYSLVGEVIVDKRIKKPYSHLLFFIERCLTPGWGKIDICCDCIHLAVVNQSTRVSCPFYHKAQSCVSMCFNLIEMADPRPLVCLVEARSNTRKTPWSRFWQIVSMGGGGICSQITVPDFEKHVVQKYWKEGAGQRVHYDANVFQKRSRFLMMLENFFKKFVMEGPTIFFMAWLHNALHFSILSLGLLTGTIHLIYIILLFFVQMKLFPFARLPKFVAYVVAVLGIIALFLLFAKFVSYNIIEFFVFFLFVKIAESFLRFLVYTSDDQFFLAEDFLRIL